MKMKKLFMSIMGALALTACSSEEVIPDKPLTPEEGDPRYMSVSIRNVSPSTRAAGDQNGDFEEGYYGENNVKSLRFYFFDEEGNPAPITFGGKNYYNCEGNDISVPKDSVNMPNVEKILNAVIVINTNLENGSPDKIKKMVAIVNFDGIEDLKNEKNFSLHELTGIVNKEAAATQNGFLMTSSAFYNDGFDKNQGVAVDIKDTDIQSTRELAETHPVDVYVERVVAKVRVTQDWDSSSMKFFNDITLQYKDNDGNITKETGYIAVALTDKNTKKPLLESDKDDAKQIYVIFQNWDLWWTADKSYLFKKVDNWTEIFTGWNDQLNHRSYWAVNPTNVNLAKHRHDYPSRKFGDGKGEKQDYKEYTAYCLENAGDSDNLKGFKNDYDPNTKTSNRTLVYLKAKLVTLDNEADNATATPVDLAEWGGRKYTKSNVLTAMFEPNVNQFFFLEITDTENPPVVNPDDGSIIESESTAYKFNPLTTADLELVPALVADMADTTAETSPRYLSYVNLLPGKYDETDGKQLYKQMKNDEGNNVYVPVDQKGVNDALESIGGTKVWDGGDTYYYHELDHLGKTGVSADETPFKYGVVRNHIYEVSLNTVYGLGTPVLSYEFDEDHKDWENIIPQKPSPTAYFLGARLNILSWRIVKNDNVSLDW